MYIHIDSKHYLNSGMVVEKEPYSENELILPEMRALLPSDFYPHIVDIAQNGLSLWGFAALTVQKGGLDIITRMRELTFEMYRWRHCHDKPSRLQSFFAWIDIEDARKFRAIHGGRLFEVKAASNMPDFIADENVFNSGDASKYWTGRSLSNDKYYQPAKECLLTLPILVLREIEN